MHLINYKDKVFIKFKFFEKMKKIIITTFIALFAISSYSQTNSEIDYIQKAFGLEKLQLVMAFVEPGDENKEVFLDLYEAYEEQRMELGKERVALLEEYAEKWEGMTNEQADAWMKKVLDLSKRNDKLIRTYFKKIKKATSATTATQFYQVELYIATTIRYAILENIPFVGEK